MNCFRTSRVHLKIKGELTKCSSPISHIPTSAWSTTLLLGKSNLLGGCTVRILVQLNTWDPVVNSLYCFTVPQFCAFGFMASLLVACSSLLTNVLLPHQILLLFPCTSLFIGFFTRLSHGTMESRIRTIVISGIFIVQGFALQCQLWNLF
jgi:hypothetical protein